MRILFIGGTGIISTACARLAVERGFDLTLLTRGRRSDMSGAQTITVDASDATALQRALERTAWDAVVDFISFTPADVESRIAALHGRTRQYVFISSASVYQRPVTDYLITESTPLSNPFWDYSRHKIACEERLLQALREENFPAVFVRPSYTYDETVIPLAIHSSIKPYTVVDRMRRGAPVIIPGDGTSLWTNTHSTDFAKGLIGLLGHQRATGHAFHITSDEVLSWNQIYQAVAEAAGVASPNVVHIASDFIVACLPEKSGGLHGDKATSVVLDNSKIKRFVPDFVATTRFRDGIRRSIEWYDANPARRQIDEDANRKWDRLVATYQAGLDAAKREFGT
jgi:nucleoside-diphosphate-sugar epimerase